MSLTESLTVVYFSTYWVAAASVMATLLWATTARKKSRLPLPPGPKGYPIIGNLLARPQEFEWQTYYQWSKDYKSDVVATKIFNTNFVILNTIEAVNDLFDKRSSIYSGRPQMESLTLMGMDEWDVALMPNDDYWRYCRKLMHQEFHAGVTNLYYSHELKATHAFLRRMLKSPGQLFNHVQHLAGETIISITYGIDVLPENDPYIAASDYQTKAGIRALTPGFFVDLISPLKYVPAWFPGAGFQRFMRYTKHASIEWMNNPLSVTKQQMNDNTHRGSFVSRSLERRGDSGLRMDNLSQYDRALRAASCGLYAAGSDTTRPAILSVVLGLLSNPSALRQAQRQIDKVIGRDRLPQITDRDSLPWVTAIMYEILRWNPVTPIALPHKSSIDDEYRGFHIPAGSVVIANAWGMFHDEDVYPDPFVFKPERFMKNDVLNPDVKDPTSIAFGFGRRICPGRYMAQASVWIAAANIIAAFNISKSQDENGQYIEPSYKYTSMIVSNPEPFICEIVPRDDAARRLIEETINFDYGLI